MSQTALINGEWSNDKGEALLSICPASGKTVWQGYQSTKSDCENAVSAAHEAYASWSLLPFEQRRTFLEKYVAAIKIHEEAFARAISEEVGKPLWESKTEVGAMLAKLNGCLTAYDKRTPTDSFTANNMDIRITHRPHGVVVILGPYNFPGHFPNGQIIPALLAGNTVVFKPSEQTPKVASLLMQCVLEAGIPAGVVNMVHGGGAIGQTLLNQDIAGVFFTGSYQTGKKIHAHFAGRPEILLALEMGGNNPLLIDEVEDIEAAVFNTVMSGFITAGQRCTCARRLLVPNSTFGDAFIKQLVSRMKSLKVAGFYETPEPFMGAVISKGAAENLLAEQQGLLDKGAEALLPMKSLGEGLLTPGLLDVSSAYDVADEELFGPVLQLTRYDSIEDGLTHCNNTAYGLAAAIMTDSKAHADYFYQRIRAGIVNINRQMTGASGALPFGGIGKSGNHRPAAAYAADFCAYPMASLLAESPIKPQSYPKGYA